MRLACIHVVFLVLVNTKIAEAELQTPLPINGVDPRLTVRTITGIFTGLQNPTYDNVREFRSIPYALPPLGERRWLPPSPLPASRTRHSYSWRFPPPCPQYESRNPTVWNSNITDFNIRLGVGQSHKAGASAQSSSEDCLHLAVWAPIDIGGSDRTAREGRRGLPVVVFVPGGSFQIGGVDIPYQNPAQWVSRSQAHVGVVIPYRLNIFGFPNAAGLEPAASFSSSSPPYSTEGSKNLGLLDVRMGLEWVYANIGAFGGDRDRILLWGQSAGGVLVDSLNYAYHDDVLASALFLQSGAAVANGAPEDVNGSNFTFVAKGLGCDFPGEPAAELECMRQVPATLITNFIGRYQDNRTEPSILFRLRPDNVTIFDNYTQRTEQGLVSKVPAIISLTANEQSSLIKYPRDNVSAGPNQTEVDRLTVEFVCLVSNATDARVTAGLDTYRYQFAGNYSNLAVLPWMGAFHGIDVAFAMGTYGRRFDQEKTGPDSMEEQMRVSEALQDHLLAFADDPQGGLRRLGWWPQTRRVWDEEGAMMLRFGSQDLGRVVANVSTREMDDACLRGTPYNHKP